MLSCRIFNTNLYFSEMTKVFKQPIIRRINKHLDIFRETVFNIYFTGFPQSPATRTLETALKRDSKKPRRLTRWKVLPYVLRNPFRQSDGSLLQFLATASVSSGDRDWSEEQNQRADCRAPAIPIPQNNFSLFNRRSLRQPFALNLRFLSVFVHSRSPSKKCRFARTPPVIPLNWNFIKLCLFPSTTLLRWAWSRSSSRVTGSVVCNVRRDFFLTVVWQVFRANSVSFGSLNMRTSKLIWKRNVSSFQVECPILKWNFVYSVFAYLRDKPG